MLEPCQLRRLLRSIILALMVVAGAVRVLIAGRAWWLLLRIIRQSVIVEFDVVVSIFFLIAQALRVAFFLFFGGYHLNILAIKNDFIRSQDEAPVIVVQEHLVVEGGIVVVGLFRKFLTDEVQSNLPGYLSVVFSQLDGISVHSE